MADLKQEYGKIVTECWRDEAFKKRFVSDPAAVLKERGVRIEEGVAVKVVQDTDKTVHLVLPPKPAGELSEEQLEKVAGGKNLYDQLLKTWQ
ncbi:MAG: NHLP leader peptide family RiPP precursor [Elusimicrobiota bacterium]